MIRLAAVDDDRLLLGALAAWLADIPDLCLVTTADTVDGLLRGGVTGIDVVLLDLLLADGSDPAGNVRRIAAAGLPVLMVSVVAEPGRDRERVRGRGRGLPHQRSGPRRAGTCFPCAAARSRPGSP